MFKPMYLVQHLSTPNHYNLLTEHTLMCKFFFYRGIHSQGMQLQVTKRAKEVKLLTTTTLQ